MQTHGAIFRAETVRFKDETELHDVCVWMQGSFVVIAEDEDDVAPTWYNADTISSMENVLQIKSETKKTMRVGTW